ncbi:hypothetical protein TPL01_08740 [Sulfuriferula plumbiphila]|uniref:DUF1003 domain-containing protein n=1 Tax=Sulfuriferula plumbiphila TaxID=171865 RepID=A0A512L5I2_9PROT|nr:DUF1003 domain-containing protein [Sulfuriferula plumbiphila]BBP03493.1 hypothetical protein SFPGR_09150 [Sulfuriferula plumbiphila]GEP29736.1 hypothetical protein TPL01_08740 [Sulfuriferula plumbiphila]
MNSKPSKPSKPVSPSHSHDKLSEAGLDQINENIGAISAFYAREKQKISPSQRFLENISHFVGQPLYFGSILLFVSAWILANVFARQLGLVEFDEPPFLWLQGTVSLGALLTTTVVAIKQNRMAKMEEQRAHLDLQVNLLTEQKSTKIIDLLEELRRDLPMVKNRYDPEAEAFQESTDPHLVLAALDEQGVSAEQPQDTGEAKTDVERNKPGKNS